MKTLAFVVPWYGVNIPGGAEAEVRGLANKLKERGFPVRILTTCVKDFGSDWSTDFHKPGLTTEGGIEVMRFKVRKRDTASFDRVNLMLMQGRKPSLEDQKIFIDEMVNSPDLYEYIRTQNDEYSLFIYAPYMFGTTVNGIKACPQKAVMIPCFHDEAYAYMDIYKPVFESVRGMAFNAPPEEELAKRLFDLTRIELISIGVGMDVDIEGDARRFREKYRIDGPFIIYAGRKDEGKNVHTLIKYFAEYKKRNGNDLKLVLIGGGQIDIPKDLSDSGVIRDLGFVDIQDKYDAQAAALLLCQPSKNESFSIVIMESWLCGRPVLVHEDCKVTRRFATDSKGGLYFKDFFDFEGAVNYILDNKDVADTMGKNGSEYVKNSFAWDVVIRKYKEFFDRCAEA